MFSGRLEEQYADVVQQSETAQLGMWVFIATEIMFFGALVFSYVIYRIAYPEQFALAGHDSFILLGSINQALLITSSLTMALAVRAAQGAFSPEYDTPLEVIGLYWSFVDTVWFFLFACIYPLGRA